MWCGVVWCGVGWCGVICSVCSEVYYGVASGNHVVNCMKVFTIGGTGRTYCTIRVHALPYISVSV